MRQVVEELKNVLNEELAIYRRLLELGKSKGKLLVEKFSSELQNIVSQEEQLVQQLVDLEPRRKDCVGIITGDPEAKLDLVTDQVSESDGKSDLWIISDSLFSVIEEIKMVNETNQRLVEQALELTQYSIKLITRAPKPVTYGPGGKSSSQMPQSRSLINRKA